MFRSRLRLTACGSDTSNAFAPCRASATFLPSEKAAWPPNAPVGQTAYVMLDVAALVLASLPTMEARRNTNDPINAALRD
jgi:hypothetical protein